MNILEDEYHFVLVCPFYSTIRDKYIKPYYYNTPSTFKLTQLMSTDSSKHLIKLCKYLTTATMHRSDNIVTWLLLTSNIINITNITHLLLTFVLLKLLYLPFPAMCTLFYLFIYYIYVCLQNVNFLANKTLQSEVTCVFVVVLMFDVTQTEIDLSVIKYVRTYLKDNATKRRKKWNFNLTTHSIHFIYGYMASDIW